MTDKYFDLLALPPEIREMIYEQCLVSTKMIPLSNLKTRHNERPIRSRLDLNPGLLRVNRQVHAEAQGFLYAQNTFFVDILASWKCTGVRRGSCLSNRIVCAKCSTLSISNDFFGLGQRDAETLPTQWLANTNLVRRLHVALQPYSYHQWRSCNAVFPLLKYGCIPTVSCSHQFQQALPSNMSLDILIIHLSKPAMMNADDPRLWCIANRCAAEYTLRNTAEKWKRQFGRDMKREVCWLMSFARGAGRNVVLAVSAQTWELDPDAAMMLMSEKASRSRQSRCENVQTVVPSWLRRSGQLSRMSKSIVRMLDIEDRENSYMPGRDYIGEISEHLGETGILLVGSAGSDLIFESL